MKIEKKGQQPWAVIKDDSGRIQGLWLQNLEDSKKPMRLKTILAGEAAEGEAFTEEHYAAIATGSFRVEENKPEGGGGYFLMFESATSRQHDAEIIARHSAYAIVRFNRSRPEDAIPDSAVKALSLPASGIAPSAMKCFTCMQEFLKVASGLGLSNDEFCSIVLGTISEIQKKSDAEINALWEAGNPTIRKYIKVPDVARSSCFIATACYGTPDCCDVVILRKFRDDYLLQSLSGRWFVAAYYRFAPPVAAAIACSRSLRAFVRGLFIRPLVLLIQYVWRINRG
jgi:hypothetical protein